MEGSEKATRLVEDVLDVLSVLQSSSWLEAAMAEVRSDDSIMVCLVLAAWFYGCVWS